MEETTNMFIEDVRTEMGSDLFAAWLFTRSTPGSSTDAPTSTGYEISFNSGHQPDGTLGRPMPVSVSAGQLAKIKNCLEIGLPFEVKPSANHRVRIVVY
jgi:hypothetical protein